MKNIILISLFLVSGISLAGVSASVDRDRIVIGETLTLTITVDENTSEEPDLSDLGQVFTVLGSSKSTSTQIINGNYSTQTSWNISLMPQGVGENTIPPVTVGSQSTRPINITVSKSDPNAKADGDIYIEVEADKTEAYVKEQIIYTVKFFYAMSLSEGSLSPPVVKDAIVTELDKSTSYRTQRSGKTYEVVERHYAISAEKSGTMEINPIIFDGRDNSSRRNFSMFSTGKPVRAVSKPVSIEIKPIPQASIGKDWLPAKKVQISQDWSKQPYKVGEPISRTITLYVEGLSETQIPDIELGDIEGVRTYPEQPNTQNEKDSQSLKSWKQVKISLIPTHEGKIRIPEYKLEWFNTETRKVEFAKLPPMTIDVEAGDFAISKPAVPNLLDKEPQAKNMKAAESTKTEGAEEGKIETRIVEKDNGLWKILTFTFAALWLLTLLFLLVRIKQNGIIQSLPSVEKRDVSKKDIIRAINAEDLYLLQSSLVQWWNSQYPLDRVSNLGAIQKMVNAKMSVLIDDLQQNMYASGDNKGIDKKQWLDQVNGKGLLNIKEERKASTDQGLPGLYS